MGEVNYILALYLILTNVVAFVVYGIDKLKARRRLWRIPEVTLILLAVFGGSLGAWLGMSVWRHKTQNRKFTIGIPMIVLIQIILYFALSFGLV